MEIWKYVDNAIPIVIRTLLIFGAIYLLQLSLLNRKPTGNLNIVKLPRVYLVIGIVGTIFTVGITVGCYFLGEVWYECLFFIPFIVLGLSIIIAYLNWEIHIDENTAKYRTFFRRSYIFEAKEVQMIRISTNCITLKVNGKTFYIDPHATNIYSFITFLEKNQMLKTAIRKSNL